MGLKVKQADWLVKNVYHIDPTHVMRPITKSCSGGHFTEQINMAAESVVLCSMSLSFVSFGDSWFN